MTTVLITRPRAASNVLAARLQSEGFDTVIEPMLTIADLPAPRPDLKRIGAIMITSANALEALRDRVSELAPLLDMACFAVGEKTAERAKEMGFRAVIAGVRDGSALFHQATRSLPKKSSVLHICGEHRDDDTQMAIEASQTDVISWVVYRAEAATSLSPQLIDRLKSGQIDAVTLFSLRTSEILAQSLRQHALEACCQSLTAIGLSRGSSRASSFFSLGSVHCRLGADRRCCDRVPEEEQPTGVIPMTLNDNAARSDSDLQTLRRSRRSQIFYVLFFLLGLVASFLLTWLFLPVLPPSPLGDERGQSALMPIRERLSALEQDVRHLGTEGYGAEPKEGAGPIEAPLSSQHVQSPAPSALEIAHMQSDLVSLSSALRGLEGEVRQQHNDAAATEEASRNFLAMAVGFIEVRAASSTGHGFQPELQSLRRAAGNRAAFQPALEELEGVAARGAPTIDQLRQQFASLEGRASVAIDKATASTWWERLRAEFEELIAIRPLHGSTEGNVFEPVEVALAEGNLADAAHALDALPPSAREALKDFMNGLSARQSVDDALHSLAEQLIAQPPSAAAPSAFGAAPSEATPSSQSSPSRPEGTP